MGQIPPHVARGITGNEVGCSIGKVIRDEQATEILKLCLTSLQIDRGWVVQRVADITMEAIRAGETGTAGYTDRLEFEVGQLMKKKENVLEAFFSKSITKEEMRMMNERYDSQLDSLRSQLDAMKARERISYETATLQEDIRKHVTAIVNGDCDDEVFLKNSLDHMVIYRERRIEVRLNLLPQKWRFVLESLREIRRHIEEENGANFQNALKTAENSVIPTVSEACVHFYPSVLADFAENPTLQSQHFQGLRIRVLFDSPVPISVNTALSRAVGMVYRWDRYRSDAPSSPSGPPY